MQSPPLPKPPFPPRSPRPPPPHKPPPQPPQPPSAPSPPPPPPYPGAPREPAAPGAPVQQPPAAQRSAPPSTAFSTIGSALNVSGVGVDAGNATFQSCMAGAFSKLLNVSSSSIVVSGAGGVLTWSATVLGTCDMYTPLFDNATALQGVLSPCGVEFISSSTPAAQLLSCSQPAAPDASKIGLAQLIAVPLVLCSCCVIVLAMGGRRGERRKPRPKPARPVKTGSLNL